VNVAKIDFTGMVFEEELLAAGGNVHMGIDLHGYGLGEDQNFRYRWDHNTIEVAVKESFDKWANSRDFLLHCPVDLVDLAVLKAVCTRAIDQGHYDDGWALEYDVGAEYRKAKRRTNHEGKV
jgi:hypothetical protein